MEYTSFLSLESKSQPGVSFTIRRMSFERRLELMRRIRELAQKIEFLEAGSDPKEKVESSILAVEIERLYVLWGLVKVEGLSLDGNPATPETLLAAGPEELCREALAAVKAECGLSEEERKN
jgi:hypothetical protein